MRFTVKTLLALTAFMTVKAQEATAYADGNTAATGAAATDKTAATTAATTANTANAATTGATANPPVTGGEILSCTVPNTIAWTFDDGPYQFTEQLLDTLKANNIKVTFFVNGNNWWGDLREDPAKLAVLKRACTEGHQIASHTWNHWTDPNIPGESIEPATIEEIKSTLDPLDDLIEQQCGFRPKYFRAPKGEIKPETVSFVNQLGYKLIKWDTDTNDWHTAWNTKTNQWSDVGPEQDPNVIDDPQRRVKEAEEFLTAEFNLKKPSYLILDHDVKEHTVKQIVPWLIENYQTLLPGYKFVTVAECLGDVPLSEVPGNNTVVVDKSVSNLNATNPNANADAKSSSLVSSEVSTFYVMAALLISTIFMLF